MEELILQIPVIIKESLPFPYCGVFFKEFVINDIRHLFNYQEGIRMVPIGILQDIETTKFFNAPNTCKLII